MLKPSAAKPPVAAAAPTAAGFDVLGQRFGTLAEAHDWLMATRPSVPVVEIRASPGARIEQHAQTLWSYYQPGQKIVIDGQGATITGLQGKRPTVGFCLSYRPIVGGGTSAKAPAAANLEVRNLTIRGFESGGVEISPQTDAGVDHQWDGGNTAFVSGASIHDVAFRQLGSKNSRPGEADWPSMRFGSGGIVARGTSDSVFEKNSFKHLENGEVNGSTFGPGLMHAVYLRDQSSRNVVRGNDMQHISGDPVRVSNAANDNVVTQNRTRDAGQGVFVSEFYNDSHPTAPQRDSTGTQIRGNDIGNLYGQKKKAKPFGEKVSHRPPPALTV